MSYTYHSRKGKSTTILVVLIGIMIIAIITVVLFALGDEPEAETDTSTTEVDLSESTSDLTEENTETNNEQGSETMTKEETEETVEEEREPDQTTEEEIIFTGTVIAGSTTPLIDFNQADYDKAIASDKLVVLYFYANWCPICKVEVSTATYPAFDELNRNDVVGFRVNFNDNQTDSNERALASKFGVAYQHTKVFIKNDERVLKSPESWTKERYFEEINTYAE